MCDTISHSNKEGRWAINFMSASLEIKKALLEKDMNVKDLAKLLNCTPENLYKKFKIDNWKEKDVQKIAEVLGYTYIQKIE